MKKLLILLLVLYRCTSVEAQSPSKYMNKISQQAKNVRSATWMYTNSVAKNKSAKKVEGDRLKLIQTIEHAELKIGSMDGFKGSSYYRDSILSFLKVYKGVVDGDFVRIMALEDNFDKKDKYILMKEEANTKLMKASDMLDEMELRFATEHKVELIQTKSKVGEKLRKTNKLYTYYNGIFVLFFKPYMIEKSFFEAAEKSDFVTMKNLQNDFKAALMENNSKLNLKLDFDGDMSVVTATQKMFDFYQRELDNDFQKIIDFQVFKAGYMKRKADLEAKPSSDREKGEVAEFNKLVAEYNQRIIPYNELIEKLNAERAVLIDNWNNVSFAFEERNLN